MLTEQQTDRNHLAGADVVVAMPLTPRQAEIRDFIAEHLRDRGYAPSVRDIGRRFSITVNGAQQHIAALRRKGAITSVPGKARTLTVRKPVRLRLPLLGEVR